MNGRLSTPCLGPGGGVTSESSPTLLRPLLGFPSEEPNHNPGGCPIVVLVNISAKRGPVVVHIKQTYLEASRWLEIQPAAHLIRNTLDRSRATGGPADLTDAE